MSDIVWCVGCGLQVNGGTDIWCNACKTKGYGDKTSKKSQPTPAPTIPTTTARAVSWELVLQPKSTITAGGAGKFNGELTAVIDAVMTCLNEHQNDDRATDRHEEYTYWTSKKVTSRSVDYQGTRAGGNLFWIDIQGQEGVTGQRCTYWQIMVQTQIGVPSETNVRLAITSSWKEKSRAILRALNGGLPV